MNKTPDSPNSGRESVVLLLSVVLRRQVNVCSLVGCVGFWRELAGGAEVDELDLQRGGVEKDVLVFNVSVVDTTAEKMVNNLVKRDWLELQFKLQPE